MLRLQAKALCNVNAASGDGPLLAAPIRTVGSANIFVIKG
jgi:hypothetical protein